MLLVVGLALRCCMGLLVLSPVLVGGGGKPRGRCCCFVSGGDLEVFSPLRPQAQLHVSPMRGPHTDSHATSGDPAADEDFHRHSNPAGFRQPPPQDTDKQTQAPGSEGALQPKTVEDWPGAGGGQAGSLEDSSEEEDCSKEKLEERMSLNSCSDSGFRTPLCRICFQGPEQVRN